MVIVIALEINFNITLELNFEEKKILGNREMIFTAF